MAAIRIILVEDSSTDAELVQTYLKRAGLEIIVSRVETETDLKAALANFKPGLVLSDLSMPKFNGMEALAIVRAHSTDVPFIFVSGTIGEDVAINALKSGAADYVLKENWIRLVPAVVRAMRDSELAAQRRRTVQHEKRLQDLVAGIVNTDPVPLIVFSADNIIQIINPAFTRAFGWTLADLSGKDLRPLIPPEDAEMTAALIRDHVQSHRSVTRETHLIAKSNTRYQVRLESMALSTDARTDAVVAFVTRIDGAVSFGDRIEPIDLGAFDQYAAAITDRAALMPYVAACKISLSGLVGLPNEHKGDWPKRREEIVSRALSIVAHTLSPADVLSRDDNEFLIAFSNVTETEARLKCILIKAQLEAYAARVHAEMIKTSEIPTGPQPEPFRIHAFVGTVSAADVTKAGTFRRAMAQFNGSDEKQVNPFASGNLEAALQRRVQNAQNQHREMMLKATAVAYSVHGNRGVAADIDLFDLDQETRVFLNETREKLSLDEVLKGQTYIARIERIIAFLIADDNDDTRKHHLIYVSIDILRDPICRRQFVTMWGLIPVDIQRRVVLCFQGIDQTLAPLVAESAILRIAGLALATGIVLPTPFLPNLNFGLIKSRVAIIDLLGSESAKPRATLDQWEKSTAILRKSNFKVFLRGPLDALSQALTIALNVDGVIGEAFPRA